MLLNSILVLAFFFTLQAFAKEECEYKNEQTKTFEELSTHVKEIEKEFKKNKTRLNLLACRQVIERTKYSYIKIAVIGYNKYRTYLNNYLEIATRDTRDVKKFRTLIDLFNRGEGRQLILAHAQKPDQKSRKRLENLFKSRYKLIMKNPKKDFIPTISHDCELTPEKSQEKLESLISMEPALFLTPCSKSYGSNLYAKVQSSLSFQFDNGRAMVWFCTQQVTVENRFPSSKAECLSYDLLNDRSMLGDLKQSHISYERSPYIVAEDTRLRLAKVKDLVPDTLTTFMKKNPELLPEDASEFFAKVVPRECMEKGLEYIQAVTILGHINKNVEHAFLPGRQMEY